MKTLLIHYKFLVLTLLCVSVISCSNDDGDQENQIEQLLIDNSPWVFNRYEFREIIEGEDLGTEFMENDTNTDYYNLEFNFYDNGIATVKYPQRDLTTINWSLSNNTLIGIPDPDFDGPAYFENISVSESQFIFEYGHSTYNVDTQTSTTHAGTFYFD